MIWALDALDRANDVTRNSNCSDFIYGAAEYLADKDGREKVQMIDLQTVLDFFMGIRAPEVRASIDTGRGR